MTDKERIGILKKVKKLITDGAYIFMCPAFYWVLEIDFSEVLKIFPELIKHKPKDKRIPQAWWGGGEDKAIRIKVLNSMITEIKAKSNE